MIDIEVALGISRTAFPRGPEYLCKSLEITVEHAALVGCAGWCVGAGKNRIIRVSNTIPLRRQRFTLAHELAHILLGTSTHLADGGFGSYLDEESTNQIASELLLPSDIARTAIGRGLPVSQAAISELSQDANVSWMVVARKIARMSGDLGLHLAFVAEFHGNGKIHWMWPRFSVFNDRAEALWSMCQQNESGQKDFDESDGSTMTLISHVTPHSSSMLMQRTFPPETEEPGMPF